MIPQEYIQEVVRRNDIEEVIGQYVQLRRRGRTVYLAVNKTEGMNDARVTAFNPSLRLPALPLARLVRADESGSTETFPRYRPPPRQGGRARPAKRWIGTAR